MAYTEFYIRPDDGSNLNPGDQTDGASPNVEDINGTWTAATNVYTCAGTPTLTGYVDKFAALYTTGATVAEWVAQITAVDNVLKTVTLHATAGTGTRPAVDKVATGTLRIGGSWEGPNGAVTFPFSLATNGAATNAAGDTPRFNWQGDGSTMDSDITAAVTIGSSGPLRIEGYGTTAGDGQYPFILDGGTTNAVLLTVSGSNVDLVNGKIQNNATGTSAAIVSSGGENYYSRIVASGVRGAGFSITGGSCIVEGCEAYTCNAANTAGIGGFIVTGATTSVTFIRCIAHDNAGSNSVGFLSSVTNSNVGCAFIDCIADTNGNDGFRTTAPSLTVFQGCTAYANGADGLEIGNTSLGFFLVENCLFISHAAGYGINGSGSAARNGQVINCGFQGNASGTTTGLKSMAETGSINLPGDPFLNAGAGNFRLNLAAAKGVGRGTFTQTQAGYSGTLAYPDLGAVQSASGSGGGIRSMFGISSPIAG